MLVKIIEVLRTENINYADSLLLECIGHLIFHVQQRIGRGGNERLHPHGLEL
jgi:hypothetical protein